MSKRSDGQSGVIGTKPVVLGCLKSILDEEMCLLIVGIRLAPPTGGGNAMKLQAHMPTVTIGARDWRAAMIALASLFGLSIIIVALRSGVLVNNPLFERLGASPLTRPHISVAHRVSLDLHLLDHPVEAWRQFSVAHPLPANVTSSQRFSIGGEARVAFETFGEAAIRNLLAKERSERPLKLKPRHDRLMIMLMLLRLHTQSHS